jgi:ABC-type multidrug transport system ATPase subunit
LIVIASIHQPSTSTFNVFDKVFLLAKGRMCYGGPLKELAPHFQSLGFDLPPNTNPAEWILELVDTDFASNKAEGTIRHRQIVDGWETAKRQIVAEAVHEKTDLGLQLPISSTRTRLYQPIYLLQRSWIKSYRDLIAYWIRVGMYTCQ